MSQYKKIKRPSIAWFVGWVGIGVLVFVLLLALSKIWVGILTIGSMLSSVLGAILLLWATWSSIKTREELCLLTISRDNPGDFSEVLAEMQTAVDKKVFTDLEREWKLNLTGVICIVLALALFWADLLILESDIETLM